MAKAPAARAPVTKPPVAKAPAASPVPEAPPPIQPKPAPKEPRPIAIVAKSPSMNAAIQGGSRASGPAQTLRVWPIWTLSIGGALIVGAGGYFLGRTLGVKHTATPSSDPQGQAMSSPTAPVVLSISDLGTLRSLNGRKARVTGVIASVVEDARTKARRVYFPGGAKRAAVASLPPYKPGGLPTTELRGLIGKSVTASGTVHFYKGVVYINVDNAGDFEPVK